MIKVAAAPARQLLSFPHAQLSPLRRADLVFSIFRMPGAYFQSVRNFTFLYPARSLRPAVACRAALLSIPHALSIRH